MKAAYDDYVSAHNLKKYVAPCIRILKAVGTATLLELF